MTHLLVGLIAEGTTDYRFFEPVLEKALIDIAYHCKGQIDISVKIIDCDKGSGFNDYVVNASKKGIEDFGIILLTVHADADDSSSEATYRNKINPAYAILKKQNQDTHCKNMVALVPVYETESWMMVDKTLFIRAIGTKKSESELNISGNPELFNNPKERIEEAIRIGRSDMPKKMRDKLKIADLYSYLGQGIRIEKLKTLNSFIDFENNVKAELIKLNLLLP